MWTRACFEHVNPPQRGCAPLAFPATGWWWPAPRTAPSPQGTWPLPPTSLCAGSLSAARAAVNVVGLWRQVHSVLPLGTGPSKWVCPQWELCLFPSLLHIEKIEVAHQPHTWQDPDSPPFVLRHIKACSFFVSGVIGKVWEEWSRAVLCLRKGNCYCWWPFHGERTPCGHVLRAGCFPPLPHSTSQHSCWATFYRWTGLETTTQLVSGRAEIWFIHLTLRAWRSSPGSMLKIQCWVHMSLPPRSSTCGVRQACDKQL